MNEREGGCLCGSIRYTIRGEPKAVVLCHCTHCQRQSGSVFSTNVAVLAGQFELRGKPAKFQDSGDSGRPVWRLFCEKCGSPLFTVAESIPGVVVVKVGTLDDASGLRPGVEVYAAHAAVWLAPTEGATRFEGARTG